MEHKQCLLTDMHYAHKWATEGGDLYQCWGRFDPDRPQAVFDPIKDSAQYGECECSDPPYPPSPTHAKGCPARGKPPTQKPLGDAKRAPKSTEVARFADVAMFEAEPVDVEAGPKVHLLWMTPDPLGAIAAACKMYKGEVVRSLGDVSHAERHEYFEQVQKTKLKAPFEFVKFHFMIEGVTRAFTHQMVRQRTAVYAQESLRFAVKSDMPVGTPPSIGDHKKDCLLGDVIGDFGPVMADDSCKRCNWERAVSAVDYHYRRLIELGAPAEDARGLLPHNVLTRLHYSTDLRALMDHAGNRLCTQAQFEWRVVFSQIAQAIRKFNPYEHAIYAAENLSDSAAAAFLNFEASAEAWQYEALANVFRPVCYLTGKCEFKANFDRACKIRDRVDQYEANGIPSTVWENGVIREGLRIDPIKPAEWLLDPGAAR